MTTRSGLREVHRCFDEIAQVLEDVYTTAYHARDWRMINVVVALWLQMCPDTILCRKLILRGTYY